jgi:hypothetical protein
MTSTNETRIDRDTSGKKLISMTNGNPGHLLAR